MRLTRVCQKLTGVDALVASDLSVDSDGVTFSAHPRWRKPRCGRCGCRAGQYDRGAERDWRHMAVGEAVLRLLLRVDCRGCATVVTEQMPWARHDSRFTRGLEELVAYLARSMDKTAITKLIGINWRTVGAIIHRVVDERLLDERLSGLRVIGIDEFSYRRRHRYLTVVVDHDLGSDSLKGLFEQLGEAGCAGIESITMDMAGGYIKAVRENLSEARIVFDRFHVQSLASDALNDVRRTETRSLAASDDAAWIKRIRWACRCQIPAFVKLSRTIRRHKEGILAYIRERYTNAIVEGFNNRLRMISRRAYGFRSAEALQSMIFLCCGDIELNPPLPK